MKKHSTQFIGMDIGNKKSMICILNSKGEVIKRGEVQMTRDEVWTYFSQQRRSVVVMEVGTHSPWVSRTIKEAGHEVIVANARNVALIYKNSRKSDKVDAEQLARLARADIELLHPIEHRGEQEQKDLMFIKGRNALVEARKNLILHVRGMVKSMGYMLKTGSSDCFWKVSIPKELKPYIQPVMDTIQGLTEQIRNYDKQISIVSETRYPETQQLRQVAGVGPITALSFILTLGDIHRFKRNRDVGAYLGLIPRRNQSGDSDPSLGITKQGDVYLRRLLVQSAHYILGPFGPDCDLRRFGMRQLEKNPMRKKKAIIAVARKLAVLLLALLKTGAEYNPFKQELNGIHHKAA